MSGKGTKGGTHGASFTFSDQGRINSVGALFKKLRNAISNDKLSYRGQPSAKDGLVPVIGRRQEYGGKETTFSREQEEWLLHRFRRRSYLHERRLLKAGEALFLARHHSLPTRLLDWTGNALFGLYFACRKRLKEDGALWAITRVKETKHDLDASDLAGMCEKKLFGLYEGEPKPVGKGAETDDALKIVHPFYSSQRIVAQDGAFTFHSNPRQALESYAGVKFHPERLDVSALYKWRIPAAQKGLVLEELSGLGITHRTLFPDLDGIARSLWETEVLWHGTSSGRRRKRTRSL